MEGLFWLLIVPFSVVAAAIGGYLLGNTRPTRRGTGHTVSLDEPRTPSVDFRNRLNATREHLQETSHVIIVSCKLPVDLYYSESGEWTAVWRNERDIIANFHRVSLASSARLSFLGCPRSHVPVEHHSAVEELLEEMGCYPVFLTPKLFDTFFNEFCKGVLWPLFHYLTPALRTGFAKNWDRVWQAYQSVNMKFARAASLLVEDDSDVVWLHNYHLLLFPSFLRQKTPRCRLGLFMHTPFPTSDLFRCLPARANVLRSMLCCDLIGFHTYDYGRHFLSSIKRVLDLDFETVPGGVIGVPYYGRVVSIRINPAGILSPYFHKVAASDNVSSLIVDIKRGIESNRRIILAVDELDAVKGTVCKIQAFGLFLKRFPELIDTVIFIQLLSRSSSCKSEQDSILNDINTEAGLIWEEYGKDVLRIIDFNSLHGDSLIAYYRAAHVGLLSTFWDGLNVCPLEYTVCQDASNPGCLIISEFMGCSRSLSGATSVNPWKLEEVADAINAALSFSIEQRRAYHTRRSEYIDRHSFQKWVSGFLRDLDRASGNSKALQFVQVGWGSNVRLIGLQSGFSHLSEEPVVSSYRASRSRLLLLDYDGTLNDAEDVLLAAPSSGLLSLLGDLSNDPANLVFIMSGRKRTLLEEWFGSIPTLGLAAEKGVFTREPKKKEWRLNVHSDDLSWKDAALELMNEYAERTDGSFVEPKEFSLVFHYEKADPDYGRMQGNELTKYLGRLLEPWPFIDVQRYDYHRIIEVRPRGVNKGFTSADILQSQEVRLGSQPSFVLAIGDDRSDEDMFIALEDALERSDNLFTCCVGLKPSKARFYLHDSPEVLHQLQAMAALSRRKFRSQR